MAYVIGDSSIIEVQMIGLLHGQTIRNVFHYLYPPGEPALPDGRAELVALLADFESEIWTPLKALTSEEYRLRFLTAQVVVPTRRRAVISAIDELGSVSGNALPSYCAVVVSKFADTAGPKFQGRNYFAGIPSVHEEDSRLEETAYNSWVTFSSQLASAMDGDSDVDIFLPTIQGPTTEDTISDAFAVTGVAVKDVLRAQRRREFGVGE